MESRTRAVSPPTPRIVEISPRFSTRPPPRRASPFRMSMISPRSSTFPDFERESRSRTVSHYSQFDMVEIRPEFEEFEDPGGFEDFAGSEEGPEFEDLVDFPEFQYEPPRRGPPQESTTVNNFLNSLTRVRAATLSGEEKLCPICTNKYDTPSAATESEPSVTESCIRLRCHHLIGKNCIKRWLNDEHTTCPICRATVYDA